MTVTAAAPPHLAPTVIRFYKKCAYEGPVPWDTPSASAQWQCPQCQRHWPFLDFDHLWFAPGRDIAYRGAIDRLTGMSRVWRQSDEDWEPQWLESDPDFGNAADFEWGYLPTSVDDGPRKLAFAILYDFYEWLSWADTHIMEPPYSQRTWALTHTAAFLLEAIVRLPEAKPWMISDADMSLALRQIVPTSFPVPDPPPTRRKR